jgi:BirA family biotin operon repressor/biotin-[acetyl-CoA-carboxylase] ligase
MNAITFPILRLLADGEFHSGEAIASHFGVTRATVWNALKDAESLGVELYSVRGKGYKLPQSLDFLDAKQVQLALGAATEQISLELHDIATSTNSLLTERATKGAAHGTCIAAELQRAGRGRRGRSWVSGLGSGLTFSLLWRFNGGASALGGLSLAVGVALARGLREVGAADVALKWPNDILYRGRKLAGILIELQGEMLGPSTAIIGIGLNVRLPDEARNKIDQPVADLAETAAETQRSALLGSLLRHLGEVLAQFEQEGFTRLRDEWQSLHAFHQQAVRLSLPDGSTKHGIVSGIAEDGTLLVEIDGTPQRFSSAEISLRGSA